MRTSTVLFSQNIIRSALQSPVGRMRQKNSPPALELTYKKYIENLFLCISPPGLLTTFWALCDPCNDTLTVIFQVTHIYSPRYGKLISLVYDERGFLIFAQMFRHKYYIATDQCGTPVMVFNQYGETVREIMRSPYGHIVYDSNPYIYLPIDFCGGLLDQVGFFNRYVVDDHGPPSVTRPN